MPNIPKPPTDSDTFTPFGIVMFFVIIGAIGSFPLAQKWESAIAIALSISGAYLSFKRNDNALKDEIKGIIPIFIPLFILIFISMINNKNINKQYNEVYIFIISVYFAFSLTSIKAVAKFLFKYFFKNETHKSSSSTTGPYNSSPPAPHSPTVQTSRSAPPSSQPPVHHAAPPPAASDDQFAFDASRFHKTRQEQASIFLPYIKQMNVDLASERDAEAFAEGLRQSAKSHTIAKLDEDIDNPSTSSELRRFLQRVRAHLTGELSSLPPLLDHWRDSRNED